MQPAEKEKYRLFRDIVLAMQGKIWIVVAAQ